MITVQKPFDSDNGIRLQFAEAELKRQSKSSSHLEFLTFSDEAHFHLQYRTQRLQLVFFFHFMRLLHF